MEYRIPQFNVAELKLNMNRQVEQTTVEHGLGV
jgi:hypothetical protein